MELPSIDVVVVFERLKCLDGYPGDSRLLRNTLSLRLRLIISLLVVKNGDVFMIECGTKVYALANVRSRIAPFQIDAERLRQSAVVKPVELNRLVLIEAVPVAN